MRAGPSSAPSTPNSGSQPPLSLQELQRQRLDQCRFVRLKERSCNWFVASLAIGFELFILRSSLLCFLLPSFVPAIYAYWLEYGIFMYTSLVSMWMGLLMLNTGFVIKRQDIRLIIEPYTSKVKATFNRLISINKEEPKKVDAMNKSWVDGHSFGVYGTPVSSGKDNSVLSSSLLSSSSLNSSNAEILNSSGVMKRSRISPYTTTKISICDTIATKEKLDDFLSKMRAKLPHMDLSSFGNGSFFNVTDIGAGDRKGYQLSEDSKPSDSIYNVQFSPQGRVSLSPKTAESDGDLDELGRMKIIFQNAKSSGGGGGSPRKLSGSPACRRSDSTEKRRLSRSSPDPLSASSSASESDTECEALTNDALLRGEPRLRSWIVTTILLPIRNQIRTINSILEKEPANPPLRIGVSNVDALKAALSTREVLQSSSLPFLLPYLSVHTNQAYLLSRIEELAADKFMNQYHWNAGGREPYDEKSTKSRQARRPWGEHLPTDASLLFDFFSIYMDSKVSSNPLVGSSLSQYVGRIGMNTVDELSVNLKGACSLPEMLLLVPLVVCLTFHIRWSSPDRLAVFRRIDQPFTAVYTLKTPQKPSPLHTAPGSFYLHMTSLMPPHWELVVSETGRSHVKTPVVKGSSNLFHALLQFVHHAKVSNGGRIDVIDIGRCGLGIDCILE